MSSLTFNKRHHEEDRSDHGRTLLGAAGRRDHGVTVEPERDRTGRIAPGPPFFGWLAATGSAVLLSALAALVGAGGGLVTLVVLLVACLSGGFVAGRMARSCGLQHGALVWMWVVVTTVAVALLARAAGDNPDVTGAVSDLATIAATPQSLGIAQTVAAGLTGLLGATLGGLAGASSFGAVGSRESSESAPEAAPPSGWRARAYCGPAHGYSWSISGTATPPILWEDAPVEVRVRYRLVHHPLTHLPARDQRGNLIYMPVRHGFES